ncbi:hypothetical protein RPALISO_89 [Ruegeria phage RpAliso]|nr:hypothetical protein RPALISO_89 [Ruegeria phage RpAliso]
MSLTLNDWHESMRYTPRKGLSAKKTERAETPVAALPLTGKLHNWRKVHMGDVYRITGDIEGDALGRFPDGLEIHTSVIAKIEGDRAVTLNSVYQLVGEPLEDIRIY